MDEPQHDPKRPKSDGDDDVGSSRRREPAVPVSEEERRLQHFREGDLLYGGAHPAGFKSAAELLAISGGQQAGTSALKWSDARAYRLSARTVPGPTHRAGADRLGSAGQCDLADRHFLAEDHLEVKKVVRHAWSLVGWGNVVGRAAHPPRPPRSAIPSVRETPTCSRAGGQLRCCGDRWR